MRLPWFSESLLYAQVLPGGDLHSDLANASSAIQESKTYVLRPVRIDKEHLDCLTCSFLQLMRINAGLPMDIERTSCIRVCEGV